MSEPTRRIFPTVSQAPTMILAFVVWTLGTAHRYEVAPRTKTTSGRVIASSEHFLVTIGNEEVLRVRIKALSEREKQRVSEILAVFAGEGSTSAQSIYRSTRGQRLSTGSHTDPPDVMKSKSTARPGDAHGE